VGIGTNKGELEETAERSRETGVSLAPPAPPTNEDPALQLEATEDTDSGGASALKFITTTSEPSSGKLAKLSCASAFLPSTWCALDNLWRLHRAWFDPCCVRNEHTSIKYGKRNGFS
jgi:hypothetical protein